MRRGVRQRRPIVSVRHRLIHHAPRTYSPVYYIYVHCTLVIGPAPSPSCDCLLFAHLIYRRPPTSTSACCTLYLAVSYVPCAS